MKRKINSIDVLVIVIIVAVIVAGYWYMHRNEGSSTNIVSGKKTITFIAEADKVYPDVCKDIKIGDRMVAAGTYQDGQVVDVKVEDHQEVTAKDGEIVIVNDPTMKRLIVTIEAKVNQYGPYIDFGGQKVKAGDSYWIKTEEVSAYGSVVKILDEK